jgi:nucleotide-binding universal stress UspA family protein
MRSFGFDEQAHVVAVVGYDGSEPSERALRSAADMMRDRPGRVEVVYVAHMPSTAAFSAQATMVVREGFDSEATDLAKKVDEILTRADVKWHFQRRNGDIAPELVKAGEEQLDVEGPTTHVVLVVGGSAHKIDRYLNSTPARVIRQDRFEVLVVP